MKKGKIIFLTGVSSAGKTSLARMLQQKLTEHYYWLSQDTFTDDMASEKHKKKNWPIIFQQCCYLLNHSIKLFSDTGANVIVDRVMLGFEKECIMLLYDCPVLFVHVTCSSILELRRREAERGDRDIGQGESQLAGLSSQLIFDYVVDTYENTIEECATKIINCIDEKNFLSFRKMHEIINLDYQVKCYKI